MQTQHSSLPLFRNQAREKGSREWGTFSAIAEDHSAAFHVATPSKPLVIRGEHNLLRIIAPQSRELHGAH